MRVRTAREACLEVRRLAATIDPAKVVSLAAFDEVAVDGLANNTPTNYELTDQLADRLAQAHKLLGEIREGTEMATLSGEIDQALALPPDLEMMVERRIR